MKTLQVGSEPDPRVVALVKEATSDDVYKPLLAFATRKLRNSFDAENAVHNVLIRQVASEFATYNPAKGKLKTYLTRCVANECNRLLREWKLEYAEADDFVASGGYGDTEQEVQARERCEMVAKCFERMGASGEILIRHYLRDESLAEIATALKTKENNVKQRLNRARKEFGKLWNKIGGER